MLCQNIDNSSHKFQALYKKAYDHGSHVWSLSGSFLFAFSYSIVSLLRHRKPAS